MSDETDDIRCPKCGMVSLGCSDADCPEADPGLSVAELNAIAVALRSLGFYASPYDLKAIDEAVMAVRRMGAE